MSGENVRVLLADSISKVATEMLEAAGGFEVQDKSGISADELVREIKDYDVVIIRSRTRIDAKILEAATRLKLIGRAGIGIDNVDLPEATRRGVVVMNAPKGNSVTTAELALAHLFGVARHLSNATESMRGGKWEKKRFMGRQLEGATLGVVGMGNIGQIVAERALGLGMKVLGFDPFVTAERMRSLGVEHHPELNTLLRAADFVTLHTPITPKTRHLIGAAELEQMQTGAYLINCARGGIVDEKALYDALENDKIAGAALDVFEEEPPIDNPLLTLPNIFTTPHIGAATREAQLKVAIELVEQVIDYFVRNVVRNAVNLPRMHEKEQEELWPFVMLARTLGEFAGRFYDGALREITVTYYGPQFDSERVKMVTNAALKGILSAAIESPVTLVNASMVAAERGLVVREVFKRKTTDFARALNVQVAGDRDTHDVQGALFGDDDIRLVKIDGYRLEAVPQGALLITQNVDVPGIIGKVGTLLGKASVNISRMQVSLNRKASNAAMAIWSLDEPAPAAVLKDIAELESIDSCKQITL